MHICIIGSTLCGKTTLAKQLAKRLGVSGNKGAIKAIAYNPQTESQWTDVPGVYAIHDAVEFYEYSKEFKNGVIICDEVIKYTLELKKAKITEPFSELTYKRHDGCMIIIIATYHTSVTALMRQNLRYFYLFRHVGANLQNAKNIFGDDVDYTKDLRQYEYIRIDTVTGQVSKQLNR